MPRWINHTRTAQRALWHGKIKPMLEDDATWQPFYRSLSGLVIYFCGPVFVAVGLVLVLT